MFIERLRLKGFRNYESEEADFSPGLNVLRGANAGGKTNLLEAVYVAGVGKSLRTNRDGETVRWGGEEAVVKLTLFRGGRRHEIEIRIDARGKKRVIIDGIPQVKIAELLGYLNIVFFSPDELKLVKEGPAERRRFMDISLCQQSKLYLKNLSAYNKALLQRNKLLKMNYKRQSLDEMLDVFDVQLAKSGAYVMEIRGRFVENLKKTASDWHRKISGGTETLTLEYETAEGAAGLTKEETAEFLIRELKNGRQRDIDAAFTGIGPHRDDLKAEIFAADGKDLNGGIEARNYVENDGLNGGGVCAEIEKNKSLSGGIEARTFGGNGDLNGGAEIEKNERKADVKNGIDVRKFGSQGQQRSAALSLKLAEIESFRIETGETPVLLLDDVLSELDLARQKNLIEAASGIQTILTCTHFDIAAEGHRKEFVISNGKIIGRGEY
ncbi:MAG: DNA replication/repair protein RecF [Clostridiales bacterium]|jgi:DNA replication and repair protein RecF|nr:DNA replication/repair protein RecF [Clostridiales bacterium]